MTHDAHALDHGGAHNGHRGPLLPASANIGVGGAGIVVVAILLSIMQGSFVVSSSRDMHIWAPIATIAQGTAPWSPTDANNIELPPWNPGQ